MNTTQEHGGGFQRVLSDVADLCELQWQLLAVDGQEAKRRAIKAAIFMGLGVIVALTSLTAAVIAAGYLIHEQFELSVGVSFLITFVAAMIIAVISLLIGMKLLSRANESLSETKREFAENLRWIKSVILSPKTSARNQLRRESFSPVPPRSGNGRF